MDLALVENRNGGDLVKQGNDLAMVQGWSNMPYLAMFGGNVASVTKDKLTGEQNFDYWGNNLFMQNDTSIQFNSLTEKALREIPLTSAGRGQLQKIIEQDLDFMNAFSNITVIVTIPNIDKVRIEIQVRQDDNVDDNYKAYIYVWDVTTQSVGDFSILDFNDDFYL